MIAEESSTGLRKRTGHAPPAHFSSPLVPHTASGEQRAQQCSFVDLHADDAAEDTVADKSADDGVLLTTLLTSSRSCLLFCVMVAVIFVAAVLALYSIAWLALSRRSYPTTYESGFRYAAGVWLCAQLPLWLFILFASPSKKQRLSWVVQVIFIFCFVTYLLKGWQALPVYYDLLGHELYPIQYVEWGCTTPMMLLLLCNVGKRDIRSSLRIVIADVLMIAAGFAACIAPTVVWMLIALSTSFVFFGLTVYSIHRICSDYRATLEHFPRIWRSIVFLELWLFVTYSAMPLIWVLGALEALDDEQVSQWYLFAETLGKLLYSSILLIVNFEIIDYHENLLSERLRSALEAKVQAEEAERKLAQEETKHLQERHELIRRNHERMQEFLRYFLHEVRVPLNSVCLTLESMQSEKPTGPPSVGSREGDSHDRVLENRLRELDQAGVDMWRETQRMTQVVNSVLSLQQFSDDRVWLDNATASLQHICDRALQAVQGDAERAHLTLSSRIDHRIPRVLTDEPRLFQMVLTLLNNAIAFTPYRSDRINLVRLTLTRCAPPQNCDPVVDGELPPLKLDGSVRDEESTSAPGEVVHVRFAVRDTGYGLSDGDLANIYRPYVHITAGEERKGKKTGVELAICRAIAALMGGRVGVSSREHVGSEFFFELPFTVSKEPAITRPLRAHPRLHLSAPLALLNEVPSPLGPMSRSVSPSLSPPLSSLSLSSNSSDTATSATVLPSPEVLVSASSEPSQMPVPIRAVLIVEDVDINRKLLAHLIHKKTGASVEEAVNGQVAVDRVRPDTARYDVILCDSEMPVKSGPDAVREMRVMGVVCPIIGVTANALQDDQRAFMACGLDEVVTKPVNMRVLLLAMDRALRRRLR